MKVLKYSIFFLSSAILLIVILPINRSMAITGNFTVNMRLLNYGFKSTRNEASKSIDKITIPEFKTNIDFLNAKKYQFSLGYRNDYILQSIAYGGITLIKKNFKIGSGLSLGFYNELPLKFIPGAYGLIELTPIKKIKISIYGYSSIFLKRLFSLESATSDFDQNILNCALFYLTDYVDVGIKYNTSGLYKLLSSGFINNSLHDYQFEIKTELKNSIINSDTTIGGSDSIYKTNSIYNRLIQIYVDETVIMDLKSFNIAVGSRVNILSFTLKDIKSTSPPKLPYFNFYTGINYKFGK